MKKVVIFVAICCLFVVGVFLFLTGDALNDLVKSKIEEVGKQVTEQVVTVGSVDIKLFEGTGIIKDIILSNPDKYSAEAAFSLNDITLSIDSASFATDLIIIDKIIINKPEAFVEFTKTGGSNIKDILDAIKRNSATSDPTTSDSATSDNETDEPKKREPNIRVNHFILTKTALTVDLSKLDNKAHQLTLADINLTNIGGDSGIPASQFGAELLKEALSSIWKQAKNEQTKQVKEKVKNKIKDKFKSFLDKL